MQFTLAVHGGAGTIARDTMTAAAETGYRAGLEAALRAGHAVLAAGGAAMDAVVAAVVVLEDDPLFNAGRGAVFTAAGRQEMDAAVMDGQDRAAGAVAGIMGPRNPVLAARAVMRSDAVMLAGEGALAFCREAGLAFEEAAYFHTASRFAALQRMLSHGAGPRSDADRHGTVGAVARDAAGALAAATSTGGMTGKRPGRVGDSPLIGAGTWADRTCAVSATGHGEWFMRYGVAHEIAARMRLAGQDLATASGAVVAELHTVGGGGGVIAVDAAGGVALPFNSDGMYRGVITAEGVARTGIHGGDLIGGSCSMGPDIRETAR